MDNKDDEKRRVMTPPVEWASSSINKIPSGLSETSDQADKAKRNNSAFDKALGHTDDDADWLGDDFSDEILEKADLSLAPALAEEEETPVTIAPPEREFQAAEAVKTADAPSEPADQGDSWLDLDNAMAEAAELLSPASETGDGWNNDEFLTIDAAINEGGDASPADAGSSTFNAEQINGYEAVGDVEKSVVDSASDNTEADSPDDADWIDASSAINNTASQAPLEPAVSASGAAPTGAESLLTDHAAVPERKFPMWPALLLAAALILLLLGGWGALSERSALKARINALEQSDSRANAAGDLDAKAEQALKDDNQSLRLQLATMREQYAAMSSEIRDLQETLAAAENNPAQRTERAAEMADSEASEAASEKTEAEILEPALTLTSEDVVPSSIQAVETAAPVTPAGTEGLWFVNLGSYIDRDDAVKAIQKLKPMDEGLVIMAGEVKGRTYFRVRAINFPTRSDAQAAAKQYETTFKMKPLWVGKGQISNLESISPAEVPEQPVSPPTAKLDLEASTEIGDWFIYIDTFATSKGADDRAQLINEAGFEAKIAVEFRRGALFYRVQVVGIESEAQGNEIIAKLKSLEDMPNLQLRRF